MFEDFLMSRQHLNQHRAQMLGRDILRAKLHNARSTCFCVSKENPEIEIMREDDCVILPGPFHDFGIGSARIANGGPVRCLKTVFPQEWNPLRRETHIHDNPHATISGTSNSSTRHAA